MVEKGLKNHTRLCGLFGWQGVVGARARKGGSGPPRVVHFAALAKTSGRKMLAACGLAQRGGGADLCSISPSEPQT
jgi:hypothetical protein